ncbi:hypothetical protein EDC01DRAFT_232201 [Geopyxis carbonaria]|nr:hypothetical protein EDC01DRAFT_232201 [Geopyxis carbonaria]
MPPWVFARDGFIASSKLIPQGGLPPRARQALREFYQSGHNICFLTGVLDEFWQCHAGAFLCQYLNDYEWPANLDFSETDHQRNFLMALSVAGNYRVRWHRQLVERGRQIAMMMGATYASEVFLLVAWRKGWRPGPDEAEWRPTHRQLLLMQGGPNQKPLEVVKVDLMTKREMEEEETKRRREKRQQDRMEGQKLRKAQLQELEAELAEMPEILKLEHQLFFPPELPPVHKMDPNEAQYWQMQQQFQQEGFPDQQSVQEHQQQQLQNPQMQPQQQIQPQQMQTEHQLQQFGVPPHQQSVPQPQPTVQQNFYPTPPEEPIQLYAHNLPWVYQPAYPFQYPQHLVGNAQPFVPMQFPVDPNMQSGQFYAPQPQQQQQLQTQPQQQQGFQADMGFGQSLDPGAEGQNVGHSNGESSSGSERGAR